MASDSRLSKIETLWSVVRSAHGQDEDRVHRAQELLIERYGGAVRRYLGGALRNDELADELYQEFALSLVKQDFSRANPEQGRFRSYLKTILFRMVALHYRRHQRTEKSQATLANIDLTSIPNELADDRRFDESWRDELLASAWGALEQLEESTGKPVNTALRVKLDHPQANSDELAELIGNRIGRSVTAANARVMVHRSREAFADQLIDQVAQTLDCDSDESLQRELADIGLLEYCRHRL